ncbi:30S ribosomal protein S12 methylthiotransferase RimO, partial [Selenomonadales bacterium OttesenSCG-928-I06]|nr:30S ribosomal protein S12 methylthiotransferase RimO [Selenomonadales bacterium OttesenSCG-928-I06]
SKIPNVVIRTSLIVGFPGEDEESFETLKSFMEKQKFEHLGIFTYSQEENTPAAKLKEQIDPETKEERYHELMALQSKISQEINEEMAEKEIILDVIIESIDFEPNDHTKKVVAGRSYREAPDIDGCIYIENCNDNIKVGDTIKVKIIQGFSYDLLGEQIEND